MEMMEKLNIDKYKIIDNDDQLIEQMKAALYACPLAIKHCKSLGMTQEVMENNIVKIYDFVRDINYCRKCPGLKKCTKENAYLTSKVTYNNGIVDTQLAPCRELLKRVSFERQFKIKDFPDEWLDARTTEYDVKGGEKNNDNPIKQALESLTLYILDKETRWIYLRGGNKTGKSYLAAAMVIDLAIKEKPGKVPVCYINAPKRIRELCDLAKTKNEEFKNKLDLYCTIPVLVIDDFGNEYKNDYVRDAIINEIISSRCNKGLFTVFTSNFSLDEIQTLYAGNSNPVGSIMASRIVKTIKVMCARDKEIDFGDLPLYK